MARDLARDNEVWGIARFGDPATRTQVEEVGVKALAIDLADPDFSELPDDFTYVLHLAVVQTPGLDYDFAIRANAEGTGLLLQSRTPTHGTASARTIRSAMRRCLRCPPTRCRRSRRRPWPGR